MDDKRIGSIYYLGKPMVGFGMGWIEEHANHPATESDLLESKREAEVEALLEEL